VFSLYTAQWESAMQDAMTNGQSSLIHGQPSPAPDLEAYGCTLLSPGTPMMLEGGNIVPVVTAKLSNGTIVKGVTLAGMVAQQQYHGAGSMSPQSQPADAPNPQLDAGLANSLSEELQHTLNAAKINVTAENGHVTLAGTVDTTADREEAARIAEARPNVRILTNSLIVQAAARPTADIPAPIVDNSHENTADRADAKTSKLVPVENPNPSTQPLSIPEIDRQAIALWSQKRYSEAIPLFNQACSGGNAGSCYHLGLMYDFGQGVAQDFPRAATFYSKSCNAGNGAACYNLSMLQQYQPGGAVCNSVAVTRNLSRSCDTGIATSCSIVGYSYIHGCGVAKDTEKGRQLLSKGCSLGDHNACDGIK
jgi:TPR repeat protein